MTDPDREAERAITALIHTYCRAVDRIDAELGKSIWNPDATADYGDIYQGPGIGVIDLICAQHRRATATSHRVSNILIELHGDTAASETYVSASVRLERSDGLQEIGVTGRYLDRWSRHGGRWGLDHRRFVLDFDEVRSVTPTGRRPDGSQDREDPSYPFLAASD